MAFLAPTKTLARNLLPPALWQKLRVLRMLHSVARFEEKTVVHRYGGLELKLSIADPLALGWYDQDWVDVPGVKFLRRYKLAQGATVFNLGAHQGVVALLLAESTGPTGKVIAVEANPHNARMARRNRDQNGRSWITVEAAAVSDRSGRVRLNAALNGQVEQGRKSWGEIDVPAVTIDDLSRRHGTPHVLFIDVEGYEVHALRGAAQTLKARPDCFIEVHVGAGLEKFGGSVQSLRSHLHDYDLFMSTDAQIEPVPFTEQHELTRSRFFLSAIARA
jgi:FkbM family methyltransferase